MNLLSILKIEKDISFDDFNLIFDKKDDSHEVKEEDIMPDRNVDPAGFVDYIKNRIRTGCERIAKEEEDRQKKKYNFYGRHYNMKDINQYTDSVPGNLLVFCSNIPKYVGNKRAIKEMIRDYNSFYRGKNLLYYIEYSEKRNSVMRGLKQVFNRSFLSTRENECLNNHELCLEWINEYNLPQIDSAVLARKNEI